MIVNGAQIISVRHPDWTLMRKNWEKWRAIYNGGDDFNEQFIKQFSNLEDPADFKARKEISPSPSFAKSVVNEIANSIFLRMGDIVRKGGPTSYQKAVQGQGYGVDLHGTDMNTFMGRDVTPELLSMSKVGVWVDAPPVNGPTLIDKSGKTPYVYLYKAEEIFSWNWRRDRIEEFQAVLLVDYIDAIETSTGLPDGKWKRHRLSWIDENGQVWVRMFNDQGEQIDLSGKLSSDDFKIDLPYIPFFTMDLRDSLLKDVANHQVALANMESADMAYALKSNYPVMTEQTDDREYSEYLKTNAGAEDSGTASNAATRTEKNIRTGNGMVRRYRQGLDAPAFINPSAEPVTISMAKQAQLKDDIRTLVNLSLSSIRPKMASAESKSLDMQGLESGLAYIGLELQRGERKIAKIWADYEGEKEPAIVTYPNKWSVESDEDRRKAVEQLEDLRDTVPSKTFQQIISNKMVRRLVGDEITNEQKEKITKEINAAETITADPETILKSVEAGILDQERAAVIMGYPKDAPQKAAEEHAARLARIAASQSVGPAGAAGVADPNARGVEDQGADPKAGSKEKAASRDTTQDATPTDKTRGEGQ